VIPTLSLEQILQKSDTFSVKSVPKIGLK